MAKVLLKLYLLELFMSKIKIMDVMGIKINSKSSRFDDGVQWGQKKSIAANYIYKGNTRNEHRPNGSILCISKQRNAVPDGTRSNNPYKMKGQRVCAGCAG